MQVLSPENLELSLLDRVIQITNEEAFETARDVMTKEGILAGISSGAAIAAAVKLAKEPEFANKGNRSDFTLLQVNVISAPHFFADISDS